MAEEAGLCGQLGLVTPPDQRAFIKQKQTVAHGVTSSQQCHAAVQETRQQLASCRDTLQQLARRVEKVDIEESGARQQGSRARADYLRHQAAGLRTNIEQQLRQKRFLTGRLETLEKRAAETPYREDQLASAAGVLQRAESDIRRQQTERSRCCVQREARLASRYQQSAAEREREQQRTLRQLATRRLQLQQHAQRTAERLQTHVRATIASLQQKQQLQCQQLTERQQRRQAAATQLARQLEHTREVMHMQQQLQPPPATQQLQPPSNQQLQPPPATQQLQAMLQRRQEVLAEREARQKALQRRQQQNRQRIVATLVQEERHRRRDAAAAAAVRDRRPKQAARRRPSSDDVDTQLLLSEDVCARADGGVATGRSAEYEDEEEADADESAALEEEEEEEDWSQCLGGPAGAGGDAATTAVPDILLTSCAQHEPSAELSPLSCSEDSCSQLDRSWQLVKPNQPELRPPVTAQPCPFSWKPDVIEFRDFRVGCTYRRTVSIVNLSATRSSCRFIGVFEQDYYSLYQPMSDMLTVEFRSPGFLGTGLSARLRLEFTPRQLLDGRVLLRFQSPAGEFQVPVQFVTQRCLPRLDRETVNFGDLVVGTRVRRTLVLRNAGQKSCRFLFRVVEATSSGYSAESGADESVTEESAAATPPPPPPRPGSAGAHGRTSVAPQQADSQQSNRASLVVNRTRRSSVLPAVSPSHRFSESKSQPRPDSPRPSAQDVTAEEEEEDGDRLTPLSVIESSGASSESLAVAAGRDRSAAAVVAALLQQLLDQLPVMDFDGGLGVCGTGSGELPARGAVRLHVGCCADLLGSWTQKFRVEFDDPMCAPLWLSASYTGREFPISVRNAHLSLDLCLCGLTYWDIFEIVNTGHVASRVQTMIPDQMKPFICIQGSTALVQAGSSFKVKICFKPTRALLTVERRYYDATTHVVHVPVTFRANGRSLRGSIQAAVSSNRVQLEPGRLDFGRVTVLESVSQRVQLTNAGLSVQRWSFVSLPDAVSVQPGAGGGRVLPGETIPLDVVFSPSAAGRHQFQLKLETLDGGSATLQCRAMATTPALTLSATSVRIAGAPINAPTQSAIYVQCPKQPLEIERYFAGGGSYEFQPPDHVPVRIHPRVGFVPYMQSRRVQLTVTPPLEAAEVRVTAALLQYERLEQRETERLQLLQDDNSSKTRKKKKKTGRGGSAQQRQTVLCPEPDFIATDSAVYREAEQLLQREHRPTTRRYLVPCCVQHGTLEDARQAVTEPDVLYLELVVTTAACSLTSVSPVCLDFGPRVIGATSLLPLYVESAVWPVRATPLDPHGPFRQVDGLRPAAADAPLQRTRLCFRPESARQQLQSWQLHAGNCWLRYCVTGRGVEPQFSVTPADLTLHLPKVKPGGTARRRIVVTNECEAALEFDVELVAAAPLPSAGDEPPSSPHADSKTAKQKKTQRVGRKGRAVTGSTEPVASEPEEPEQPLWSVSEPARLRVPAGVGQTAQLEVALTPRAQAQYQAQLLLRLFAGLRQLSVSVVGRTNAYRAPKQPPQKHTARGEHSADDVDTEAGGKQKKKKRAKKK